MSRPSEIGDDPAEFRLANFIQPEQFPYESATGFVYDSGDYPRAMNLALEKLGYEDLRREQAEARKEGRLLGIGLASFTEVVGAGHGKEYDIAGLRMFDSAELRVHPTGKAILKLGVRSQGQGHETTFAQIVAEELGIPYDDVEVQEGDTDNTPYGLGTYASRSTPTAGAATAVISRKLRDKGARARRPPARVRARRPRVGAGPLLRQGCPGARRRRSRTSRSPPTRTCPTGWRRASRASTTTTRRT